MAAAKLQVSWPVSLVDRDIFTPGMISLKSGRQGAAEETIESEEKPVY